MFHQPPFFCHTAVLPTEQIAFWFKDVKVRHRNVACVDCGQNAARRSPQESHWLLSICMVKRRPASNSKRLKSQTKTVFYFMSQHRSLRAAATLGGKRNVLKRFERVEVLKKRGQWKAGDRITGLRKTKPDV
jgi:small basic protein (TIGR04137 family)